jgi:hypothetical protein
MAQADTQRLQRRRGSNSRQPGPFLYGIDSLGDIAVLGVDHPQTRSAREDLSLAENEESEEQQEQQQEDETVADRIRKRRRRT